MRAVEVVLSGTLQPDSLNHAAVSWIAAKVIQEIIDWQIHHTVRPLGESLLEPIEPPICVTKAEIHTIDGDRRDVLRVGEFEQFIER